MNIPQRIKILFLDIGGVIVELKMHALMSEISRITGIAPEQIESEADYTAYHQFERGEITMPEYHQSIFHQDGHELLSYERFVSLWQGVLGGLTAVAGMIPRLRQQAPVWYLSNTNTGHIPYLWEKYPALLEVDGKILSHEVGSRKPERRIFDVALEQAGCRPEEALFTDDMASNVAGARAAGIYAEQFTGMEGFVSLMGRAGLTV